MKRDFRLCMLVGLLLMGIGTIESWGQVVPKGDPVGTKYVYAITNGEVNTETTLTYQGIEGNRYRFLQEQVVEPVGQMESVTEYVVVGNMLAVPGEQMQALIEEQMKSMGMGSVKVDVEGEPHGYPLQGKVGDNFSLTTFGYSMNVMGMKLSSKEELTSYSIVKEEEITTPAGTFKTIVAQMEGTSTSSGMGQTETYNFTRTYWILPGFGVVKAVAKEGDLPETISTLSKIMKP